jgi:hypothetical protein
MIIKIEVAKYSKGAGEKVEEVMHEMKGGKLHSGSRKKVTNSKQAIAITPPEAREAAEKVPKNVAANNAVKKDSRKKW